jgi:hypothetical protein
MFAKLLDLGPDESLFTPEAPGNAFERLLVELGIGAVGDVEVEDGPSEPARPRAERRELLRERVHHGAVLLGEGIGRTGLEADQREAGLRPPPGAARP